MNLHRVFRTSVWVLVDRLVRLFGGFFIGIWVARYLNADGFGLLSTASAISLLLSPVAALGLDGILVRDLARNPERAAELFPTALLIRIIGGLAAWLIGLVIIRFLGMGFGPAFMVYAIVLFGNLANCGDVFDAYFQSRLQVAVPTAVKVFAFLLANGARILAIVNEGGVLFVAATLLIEPLVVSALLLTIGVRKFSARRVPPSFSMGKYLLRESSPLAGALFCYLVFSRLDQLIVMSWLGAREAGLYAVSTRLLELPLIGGMAVAGSLFPYLAHLRESSSAVSELDHYRPWIAGASLLGWLWLALWLLFGEALVGMVFGPEYRGAGYITALRSPGLLFLLNGFLRSAYLTNSGRQDILFHTSLFGAALSLGFNYIGVVYGGVVGVAIAYSMSQFVVLFLMNFTSASTRELGFVQWRCLFLWGAFWRRIAEPEPISR